MKNKERLLESVAEVYQWLDEQINKNFHLLSFAQPVEGVVTLQELTTVFLSAARK